MKVNLLALDGTVTVSNDWPDPRTSWEAFRAIAKRYLHNCEPELVAVLHENGFATMLVAENARLLPDHACIANARATAIYWTATIIGRTGLKFDPLQDPLIWGPAILIDVDKRTL